jgi:hypothetical protein
LCRSSIEENKAIEAIKEEALQESQKSLGITIDADGNDTSVDYPAATIDEISPTNLLRSGMKE